MGRGRGAGSRRWQGRLVKEGNGVRKEREEMVGQERKGEGKGGGGVQRANEGKGGWQEKKGRGLERERDRGKEVDRG